MTPTPGKLLTNATILTLDDANSMYEALAIRGDRVLALGTDAEMRALAGPDAEIVDLGGATVVPGLYAAHCHYHGSGLSMLFSVDLNSPPMGSMRNIDDLVGALRARADQTPEGHWIRGRGYDDTLLAEMRHPTREDLDRISTRHPILIRHTSGHLAVANSPALEIAGVNRNTPDPAGGVIRRDSSGEPDGVFEECGSLVEEHIPEFGDQDLSAALVAFGEACARAGVTTAVSAGSTSQAVKMMKTLAGENSLLQRVVAMTNSTMACEMSAAERNALPSSTGGMLSAGAVKLFHDGSIQGYTGYLSKPYHVPFRGDAAYRGYPTKTQSELNTLVLEHHAAGRQLAVHANGDAAIDDVLDAYEAAQKTRSRPDARHRIEHCQMAREDQLDRMAELGVSPSFFIGHVYYWGDRHRDIFMGPERAARISPLRSALAHGLRFTLHEDTPVTPVSPIFSMWAAVNRLTSSGKELGTEQRLTPLEALRASTIDAAWQNFEEDNKGSIEPGKLADFTVLAENPLEMDPEKIRDIRVLRTVVGGKTAWKSEV